MARYAYCVRTDLESPILARFSSSGAEWYNGNGIWERAPHLDAVPYGGGPFMDYDDISEEKAKEYMAKIDKL